jgi:hypothetical protein
MDDHDALRLRFAQERAKSCEILERLERAADVPLKSEERDDDDDALIAWSRGMPQPQPERHERRASREKLTDSEAQRWQAYIDGKIAAASEQKIGLALRGVATILDELRDQLRGDFAAKIERVRVEIAAAAGSVWRENSAEIEKVDRRLAALIERQIETPPAAFRLPRGAQRFTHGVNGNA